MKREASLYVRTGPAWRGLERRRSMGQLRVELQTQLDGAKMGQLGSFSWTK